MTFYVESATCEHGLPVDASLPLDQECQLCDYCPRCGPRGARFVMLPPVKAES